MRQSVVLDTATFVGEGFCFCYDYLLKSITDYMVALQFNSV